VIAKEKNTIDIWTEFSLTKDVKIRNRLVLQHLNLVKIIVGRLLPNYRMHVEYDDFLSYGILGLMDAIEKFDPQKGVKFETYASIRIKGSIIDHMREHDWISSYLRQKIKKLESAFEYLEVTLGRPATETEVAGYLNIGMKELKKLLVDSHAANVICFEELLSASAHTNSIMSRNDAPEKIYEEKELKTMLAKSVSHLSERERTVITLYYFEELSLKEIGMILGVSESRVSQIHSKTLIRLRTSITSNVGVS